MKIITISEVRELAMKKYAKGGDSIVESWSDTMIAKEIANGATTVASWNRLIKVINGTTFENGTIVFR